MNGEDPSSSRQIPSQSQIQNSQPQRQDNSALNTSNSGTISLLNFDPNCKKNKFLNSPRSKEALKRLCLEECELLIKPKEEFYNLGIPPEFQDDKEYFIEVKAEHYEKRRKEKVKMAIKERQEIIKMESTGNSMLRDEASISPEKTADHQVSYYSTNTFEQGKKKLQQMRNQQKKEIDMIIQTELRTQEMMKKNEEKQLRVQEMEQRRQKEVELKNRMAEEAKFRREVKMTEREKEQERINQMIAEKQRQEEMRRLEVQEKIQEEREVLALQKEKERREKHILRDQKIVELEQQKKIEIEKRKEERDQRLFRIQSEAEKAQKRKQVQSVQTRRNFEYKIETVRKKADDHLEEQRKRVLERQEITNEKKLRLENEMKRQMDERRNRSEAKQQEIKKTLEEKYAEEQARKAAYLYKYRQAEENKKAWEREEENQRRLKAQRELEKEHRLRQTLMENDEKLMHKNAEFLQKLTNDVQKAQERKDENIKNAKKKYIMDILKMEDALENTKRLEQVRENKKKQLADKIVETSLRLEQVQQQKEKAFLEKKKLQAELEAEKAQTLKEFEKKKKLLLSQHHSKDAFSFQMGPESVERDNLHSAKSTPKLAPIHGVRTDSQSVKNLRGSIGVERKTAGQAKSEYMFDKNLMIRHTPNISTSGKKAVTGGSSSTRKSQHSSQHSSQQMNQQQQSKSPTIVESKSQREVKKNLQEDEVIFDLQTREYERQSSNLRTEQLGDLLKLVDNAVKEDKSQSKVEDNTQHFVSTLQKQDERMTEVRSQNNYLHLAK